MKTIIIAVGVVIVMFVLVNNFGSTAYTAVNQKAETVEVEVHPEWIGEEDEEAIQAYKDVIQRKAWEADKSRLEGQIEALEDELEQVDKELGLH